MPKIKKVDVHFEIEFNNGKKVRYVRKGRGCQSCKGCFFNGNDEYPSCTTFSACSDGIFEEVE